MAGIPISQLPAKTSLSDGDLIPIVDSQAIPTATEKITYANIKTSLQNDGIRFTWKGAWVTATAYSINDTVNFNGSGYVCLSAHTSGIFATDLANGLWSLFVQAGATGATGAQGIQGLTGLNVTVLYGTGTTAPAGQTDGTIYVTYVP